jgi:HPt (histidine-containing phosphotransfer) domain-containing protein
MTTQMTTLLIDCELVAQIRLIERATGRHDMFSEFVRKLEASLAGFGVAFSDCVACGDTKGAERAAHTLKGISLQLGARALGDLFADIENTAKAGDYVEAKRKFDEGASVIAQSLEALKRA